MRTVKITLPLPSKQLSPNARCHWRVKSKAVKAARTLAYCEAINAGCAGEKWKSATMQATFYFNLNRGRDKDNAASSLKSHVDGITLAGLLVNDTGHADFLSHVWLGDFKHRSKFSELAHGEYHRCVK